MDEPDAPPRLRWRLLGWLFAAILLLPVLYVAMTGPLHWYRRWHPNNPAWFEKYNRTLLPLYNSTQIGGSLRAYRDWWHERPAPRSWRRQRIVAYIEKLRKEVEGGRRFEERMERITSLNKRIRMLQGAVPTDAVGHSPGSTQHDEEIKRLFAELHEMILTGPHVGAPANLDQLRAQLAYYEERLREWDAAKR